jgi:hypothetical protein
MDSSAYSGIQATNDDLKSFPLYGSSQAMPTGTTSSSRWNRMYDVIFQVPQAREMFLRRMRTVLDTFVKPPGTLPANLPIEQLALTWRNQVADEAQRDRAWWGWSPKTKECNFDPGIGITNGVDDLNNIFMALRRNHFYGKHSVTNTALAFLLPSQLMPSSTLSPWITIPSPATRTRNTSSSPTRTVSRWTFPAGNWRAALILRSKAEPSCPRTVRCMFRPTSGRSAPAP